MQIDGEALAIVGTVVGAFSSALGLLYRDRSATQVRLEAALVRLDAETKARVEAAEAKAAAAMTGKEETRQIVDRLEATVNAVLSLVEKDGEKAVIRKKPPFGRPPMGSNPGAR